MSNKKIEYDLNKITEVVSDTQRSMSECARILNISFTTFKRICEKHKLYESRQNTAEYSNRNRLKTYKERSLKLLNNIIYSKECKHLGSVRLKERLIKFGILENKCCLCELQLVWNNKPLVLQLDHIDGNNKNNNISNLRLLCPNCHSQTDTYCKSTHRNKVDYNTLETIITTHKPKTMYELTKLLNVTKAAGNYDTINKELIKRNIKSNIIRRCISCGKSITKTSKSGYCNKCSYVLQYKVSHPSKTQLIEELKTSNPYALGKKYGVSDNALRKWMQKYDIPTKKNELKEYLTQV